ncbi:MAG TPA: hypothetical protein VLS93_03605, partial [Anaeromyxobacteraceae bacterium]|nr:hypothetical protein [Anaeromyxobacteraceae bacterium]
RSSGDRVTGRRSAAIRTTRRPLLAAALALAALPAGGCSFLFMTRPPEPVLAPNAPVQCTRTRIAPVLDTVCAVVHGAAGIAILSAPDCAPGELCVIDANDQAAMAAAFLLPAAACTASAMSGFRSASRCREVKSLNALCIGGDLGACRALRPGFIPPTGADPWGTAVPGGWGPPPAPPTEPQAPPAQPR